LSSHTPHTPHPALSFSSLYPPSFLFKTSLSLSLYIYIKLYM
jgi:hypothetical protein